MLGIGKKRQQATLRGLVTDSSVFEAVETLLRVENPPLVVVVERDGALNLWEAVSSPAEVVRMLRDIAALYEWDRVAGGDSGAPSASQEDAPAEDEVPECYCEPGEEHFGHAPGCPYYEDAPAPKESSDG